MNAPITIPAAQSVDLRKLSFRRLDAAGVELQDDVTDGHAITHYPQLGLMFDVRKARGADSFEEANAIAAECDLLGRKGEWVVGEDVENAALINRAFHSPAVDPAAVPNMPTHGWIYTATKTAWSPDHVWFVDLLSGYVDWGSGDFEGLVVPVLRVPVSQ